MTLTGDELAGVVDLFGGLTREELRDAVREAAFRAGEEVDDGEVDGAVEAAIEDYRLVAVEGDGAGEEGVESEDESANELLVPGPTAFPELPAGAEDLPHIMDVEDRAVDRDRAGEAVAGRFHRDAELTADAGDADRAAWLVDVSYDVETWAPVDLSGARDRLEPVADDGR